MSPQHKLLSIKTLLLNVTRAFSGSSINKRFGSEPDLRIEEEQKTRNGNKHFRKKYRAPPPPTNDVSNNER